MKHRLTVWTLSWDTRGGTDCRVFATEFEWLEYFRSVIESDIEGIETREADKIRSLLTMDDIGEAYEIWQATYKPELDTYNWDTQSIGVELSGSDYQMSP
jgi:hypothetical protein